MTIGKRSKEIERVIKIFKEGKNETKKRKK